MRRMAVAGVALAVALAACGDSTPAGVEPETIGKDDFVRRADAICTDVRPRLRPLVKDETRAFVEIYRNANARARLHTEKLTLLRDLDEPDRQADQLRAYLDDVEAVAIAERTLAASAVTRNRDVVRAEERDRDDAAEREAGAARGFGFRVCGTEVVAR